MKFSRSTPRNSCAGCCAGNTSPRPRNFSASAARSKPAPASGIRSSGQCLGAADSRPPHRELRSENPRPALPHRRRRLGPPLAAPALLDDSREGTRRVIPTSVAPITFFVREESEWMMPRSHGRRRGRHERPKPGRSRSSAISEAARRIILSRHRARRRKTEIRS